MVPTGTLVNVTISGNDGSAWYNGAIDNRNTVDLLEPGRVAGTGIEDPEGTFARGIYSKAFNPAKKGRLFQLWYEAQAGLE